MDTSLVNDGRCTTCGVFYMQESHHLDCPYNTDIQRPDSQPEKKDPTKCSVCGHDLEFMDESYDRDNSVGYWYCPAMSEFRNLLKDYESGGPAEVLHKAYNKGASFHAPEEITAGGNSWQVQITCTMQLDRSASELAGLLIWLDEFMLWEDWPAITVGDVITIKGRVI